MWDLFGRSTVSSDSVLITSSPKVKETKFTLHENFSSIDNALINYPLSKCTKSKTPWKWDSE